MRQKAIVWTVSVALTACVWGGPAENLEKTFDEACQAGEPLKADQIFRKLLEKNPKVAPIRYYQAAEVSRQLGKTTDRNTRLSHYLKVEKAWNERTEQAAWELCLSARDADQFVLLATKVQPTRTLFSSGTRLLDAYREQKRSSDFKNVATAMLTAFKSDDDRAAIHGRITNMVIDNVPGFTADDAREFFEKYPCKKLASLERALSYRRDSFSPIWRLSLMANAGAILDPNSFEHCCNLNYKNEKDCAEAAKLIAKIEPLVFDGKSGKQAYHWYRMRLGLKDYFFKPNQTNEQSAALCAAFDKIVASENSYGDREMRNLMSWSADGWKWTPADCVKMRNKHPQLMPADKARDVFGLAGECDQAKSTEPYHAFLAKYPDKVALRYEMLATLAKWGDAAEVKKCFEEQLLSLGNYDFNHLLWAGVVGCKMSDKDRADFLASVFKKTGANNFWNWCAGNNSVKTHPALTNALAKAFFGTIKKDAKSSEHIIEIRRELMSIKRGAQNICPDEGHKLFTEACKVFPGVWPQPARWDNGIFGDILFQYVDLCQHSLASAPIGLKAITAKLDPNNAQIWCDAFNNNLIWNSRDGKNGEMFNAQIARARATKDAGHILGLSFPKGTAKLPDGANDLSTCSQQGVLEFLDRNWNWREPEKRCFTPDLAGAILCNWFKWFDSRKIDANWTCGCLYPIAKSIAQAKPAAVAQLPFDKVAAEIIDANEGYDSYARAFLAFCTTEGKGQPYQERYLAVLAKCEPAVRLSRLVALGEMEDVITFGNAEKEIPERFDGYLKKQLLPALKAVPLRDAPHAHLGSYGALAPRIYAWADQAANKGKPETKKIVDEFFTENVRLKNAGAQGWTDDHGRGGGRYYAHVYQLALDTTNVVKMAENAHQTGAKMNPWTVGWDAMNSIMSLTRAAELWEPLYVIVNALGDYDKDMTARAARYRAEASTHLQGVYPVTNKDPLYPLYVAADEFSRNNFERATALLKDKRNLPVFEREAIRLPPDFTAWAVEQLRLQRGAKDEMLLKARAIANQLLENESKITRELAASMMLVRAECSRDQQNFEAAKLEYQTIRNAEAYQKTKAARKAMFRAVDLMIETGNASGAESTLEYWLSQPDPEVQAQAHYFIARIAFDRKDYDETRKQLREVFAINFTHTEGRFLEGKWKLATGNEIDDTQVMIGQLSDRTMIRPGQQLAICLQDRNLSVAGGGASIPVVITTKPGGDRERIYLYPSVRDPSNFKGVILVKLAPVACSNLVLDVTGNDTVSYSVDPEFVKARGLKLIESKRLVVVDDGRLAIGVGAPKTDDGEDNPDKGAKVQEMVVTGDDGEGARTPLRPGNPLYIAVMDKDRSFGGADGVVTVDVSTSSGDKLDNVPLRETAAYSGVFRGEIPSGLPPPRAYASDTAVGFNPCDVINSKRAGEWKSLADGGDGKWFAIDTMGSYEFSNVVFRMSAPEEIRAIRLSGTLGDETTVLGLFPTVKPETRVGLRRQDAWNVTARGIVQVRAFYEKPDAPKVSLVTNLSFACPPPQNNRTHSVYFNGAFKMPSGFENLRLRLSPASTVGDTFKNTAVSILIDGTCIFQGGGAQAVNTLVTQELVPGVHRLEVFASGKATDDSWKLLWEPLGEEAREIPAEWFDIVKHPEIVEFLADKATIIRTEDGFEAAFRSRTRLRSFRVEFLDQAGPGAQISGITAADWDGKKILPVERDFSDAQKNAMLEVAPGDTIFVRYADEITSKGESRILTKTVGSSFTDATVGFYFEEVSSDGMGGTISTLHRAYRFVPGDALIVGVKDSDLDTTEEADAVKVTVRTKDGQQHEITLVEQVSPSGDEGTTGVHTGNFIGLLKTCPLSVTNNTTAIRCSTDDVLSLDYVDRENTRPGVPFARTARVKATRDFKPMITLFHSRSHKVEDRSREAAMKLEKIRRRAGNENVSNIYVEVVWAMPMEHAVCNSTNDIPVNVATPLPIRVNDPSRARHEASFLRVESVSESERRRAATDGDEPQVVRSRLALGGGFTDVSLDKEGSETAEDARINGSFNGVIRFAVGGVDPSLETGWDDPESRPPIVSVSGSDRVFIRILDENGDELLSRTVKLVSNADLALMDSTWTAGREAVHVGECFNVRVEDPDRDVTGDADRIEIDVETTGGTTRKVILAESLPHSGIFSGVVQPAIFAPGDLIPSVATGATATVEQLLAESRIPIKFGERLFFRYRDEIVLPGTEPRTLCATGTVHKGADGDVRLFSKRFRDADMAILVQFRLAECLFEQAKDYRKLKHPEKSAEAIAKGKAILEEALKNNPESAHVAQGEFLLANLYQELGSEAQQAGEKEKEKQLFSEALARFSSILAVWPEGEFGPRSQYHKAYCLEMLGDYKLAGEEYVKMTYIYPESELVGDATIRLATHYYSRERMYATAARIYSNFAKRFPNHDKTPRALFMSGSCFVKEGERLEKEEEDRARKAAEKAKKEYQKPNVVYGPSAEMYRRAVTCFDDMVEKYRANTTPELRAQALYWAGDASLRAEDFKHAYLYLKRTILEYPETEWARRARGLLLQKGEAFRQIES